MNPKFLRSLSPRSVGILLAIATGLCWAVLALGLKYALEFASTGTIVWFRLAFAFFLLFFIHGIFEPKKLAILTKPPPWGIVAGLCIAINYFAYLHGLELTSAANAQIMIQGGPLLLAVLGIFYFGEKPGWIQGLGILIATCGFGFFYWDQLKLAIEFKKDFLRGELWILLACVTWAWFGALQKILFKKYSPQQLNMLFYGLATLLLLPLADLSEFLHFSLWQWTILIFLSLNTLIAYGAFSEALKRIPASHVSLIISVNPLLTLVLVEFLSGFSLQWMRGEAVSVIGYAGAILVVTGVMLTVAIPSPHKTKL